MPGPSRRFMALCALSALSALSVLYAPHAHAQGIPPGTGAPADPFHQPCVEIRVTPHGDGAVLPSSDPQAPLIRPIQSIKPLKPFKRYVDLDDRCANLPEFAPTRDTDTTSVWYVSMPAHAAHESHATRAVPTASPGVTLPTVAS
ncbi:MULTISPECIES: hypothetical protein [unclassified Pandoraea]|uniref:hypothetical protein n=1 Tax=unclassified Pandoraea TaxID=2624094 RepID=UPI00112515CE|nr:MULTISPECIES: hypothetical protein [unclassified Pandoraea]